LPSHAAIILADTSRSVLQHSASATISRSGSSAG
jgi:hypothetical protein